MKKTMLAVAMLTVFAMGITLGQDAPSGGAPIYGVQLSIACSNTVMLVGSTNIIHCWIHNSSSNKIELDRSMKLRPATVFCLTNDSGQNFKLEPNPEREFSRINTHRMKAGETFEWYAPVIISKEIRPDTYEMNGSQIMYVRTDIKTNYIGGTLLSNGLKIKIKRNWLF